MYSRPGWFWSLPFPPLQYSPVFLPFRAFPSPLSFRPFCLLSVHKRVFSRPPPAASGPSSFVRRMSTTNRLTADQSLSWFPVQRSKMQVCTPPRPVRLVVLGLGVGGGAKETAPPAMVLSPSTCPVGVARESVPSSTLEFPLNSCGACLSVCLPPPFPVQSYLSHSYD